MQFDSNIKAVLVYDGVSPELRVPDDLLPKAESRDAAFLKIRDAQQLHGNVREQLCELAGRCCYDSLGQGRNSAEYWKHIREVNHLSVIEHAYVTFNVSVPHPIYWMALLNRRGVYVLIEGSMRGHVTLNLRAVLEWNKWTNRCSGWLTDYARALGYHFIKECSKIFPLIVPEVDFQAESSQFVTVRQEAHMSSLEIPVSFFLSGSRGFSHEQVRHRENISQRSTRYVDESESPWVEHPLNQAFRNEHSLLPIEREDAELIRASQVLYDKRVQLLQGWLMKKGVDKTTARKQARGAARGYLGNALKTEMIFTTSIYNWREILQQRLSNAADAEIRILYSQVLAELKKSCHAHFFADLHTEPSADGLGDVLVKG